MVPSIDEILSLSWLKGLCLKNHNLFYLNWKEQRKNSKDENRIRVWSWLNKKNLRKITKWEDLVQRNHDNLKEESKILRSFKNRRRNYIGEEKREEGLFGGNYFCLVDEFFRWFLIMKKSSIVGNRGKIKSHSFSIPKQANETSLKVR